MSSTVGSWGSWRCLSICQVKVVCAHHQMDYAGFGIIGYLSFLWEGLRLGNQRDLNDSSEFHHSSSWGLLTRKASVSGVKTKTHQQGWKGVRGIASCSVDGSYLKVWKDTIKILNNLSLFDHMHLTTICLRFASILLSLVSCLFCTVHFCTVQVSASL